MGIRASWAISADITIAKADFKAPLACKTIDLNFNGERQKVIKAVADKMARCWWMFYEGRYEEILSGTDVQFLFFGTDDLDNSCFMCYSLILDDIEGGKITGDEMYDFFRNTKYPKSKDLTYLEYFQRGGGPGVAGFLTEIEPFKSYGISFLAKKSIFKQSV